MLIGITHPSFATLGGAEVLLARQIAGLHARGHRVRLVTMALDPARWPAVAAAAEVRLAPKHWTDSLLPAARRQRRRVTRQAAQLAGVDVVLASGHPANLVAAESSAPRRVWYCNEPSRRLHFAATYPTLVAHALAARDDSPLCAYVRRRLVEDDAASARLTPLRRADADAVRRLDGVIANSAYAALLVRRVFGREPDAVVFPTVPPPSVAPPPRHPIDPRALRVLVHSRLELLKNLDPVLHGFARFAARHPGAHELHVVGTGPDAPRLRALAQGLVGARAHFHDFLVDSALPEIYARCDVMAAVPPDEPFGMVFPEAALRGLLLVGPDHGGPADIIGRGAYGWAVDAFSADAIAGALEEIVALSADEAAARRARAADACRARYGEEATVEALLEVLEGQEPGTRD